MKFKQRWPSLVMLVSLASLVLTACGPRGNSSSDAVTIVAATIVARQGTNPPISGPQACNLLQSKDVEAALGEPVDSPSPSANEGYIIQTCTFAAKSKAKSVVVTVFAKNGDVQYIKLQQAAPDNKPVPGIGNKAFFAPGSTGLVILQGGWMLEIAINGLADDNTTLSTAQDLAKKAIENLF